MSKSQLNELEEEHNPDFPLKKKKKRIRNINPNTLPRFPVSCKRPERETKKERQRELTMAEWSPILKKPKIETVTEEEIKNGGNEEDDEEQQKKRQEEEVIALWEYRTKEVQHLRRRVVHYQTEVFCSVPFFFFFWCFLYNCIEKRRFCLSDIFLVKIKSLSYNKMFFVLHLQ